MLGIKVKFKAILENFKNKKTLRRLMNKERELIEDIKCRKLTYLSLSKCVNLLETIKNIEMKNVQGCFIEAGCALGGSSILISKTKNRERVLKIFDVFETIPPPTKDDPAEVHKRYENILQGKSSGIDGDAYYGYQKNLYEIVQNNLKDFDVDLKNDNVHLIRGLVQNTMIIQETVAFAHIDVDWYEPVKHCLSQIVPNLAVGGSIILDDYFDWGGCKKATDEFLELAVGQFSMDETSGAMKLRRLKLC